jgi:hypothetical protein
MNTTADSFSPAGLELAQSKTWLAPQGAADYIGNVTVKTLEFWRYTGAGPRYTKAGRRVLYRRDWIDEWLENRSVTSTAEAKLVGV